MEMAEPTPPPIPRAAAFEEQATPRIEPAAAAQPAAAQPAPQPPAQPQQPPFDPSLMRDLLNALHLIHDDTAAIREALSKITES